MTDLEYRAVIVKNHANACQAKARKSADVRYPQGGLGRRARTGKSGSPISRSARSPQAPARAQAHARVDGEAPGRHRGETAGRRPPDPAAIGPGTHGPPAPTGGGGQQRRHAGIGGRVRQGGARLQPAQGHHLRGMARSRRRPRRPAPGSHPPSRRRITGTPDANSVHKIGEVGYRSGDMAVERPYQRWASQARRNAGAVRNARNSTRPSVEPRRGSLARSGWGMSPTTLPSAEQMPAMSSVAPFGLST